MILDPCTDYGGEDKADKVEVALHDGKVGEGGGRESHEEGNSLAEEYLYFLSRYFSSTQHTEESEIPFGGK